MLKTSTHGPITRVRLARTVLGRPLYEVSAYLVDGLLIDTGPPATAGEVVAWCRGRGVEEVVLTHHHEDHAGGAPALAAELGVPVWAPAATAELLARRRGIPLYRRLVWGRPRRLAGARALGEVFAHGPYRFRVIPTPGHAFDHHCLFEEERGWLVSGDLFVHERVKLLRRIEDPVEHLESLRRARGLKPTLLLCSHAGVVEDARGALERRARNWQELGREARRLVGEGLSARAATRRLLGREPLMTFASCGDFSKINLVRGLLELEEPPVA